MNFTIRDAEKNVSAYILGIARILKKTYIFLFPECDGSRAGNTAPQGATSWWDSHM